jgi:hypothetical protein
MPITSRQAKVNMKNTVRSILSHIHDNWEDAEVETTGDFIKIKIEDKLSTTRITIRREIVVGIPYVTDWRVCPACKLKYRGNSRQMTDYCWDCRHTKQKLLLKGVSKRSMKDHPDKYNELVGTMSLLTQLRKGVKEAKTNG